MSGKELTEAEMIAHIEAVLTENARLLGEPQNVFLRRRPNGGVRLQTREDGRWVRGEFRDYASAKSAYWAAGVAQSRAEKLAAQRGEPVR